MKLTRDSLQPHLHQWQEKGLLTAVQAEGIAALYPPRGRSAWVVAFAVLGSLLILGGISLIIASHWEEIPPLVKFGGLLILLAGCSVLGIEAQHRRWPAVWSECAFLATAVLLLLGLMLVSQIFHIEGHPARLFQVWTVGIALLPILTRRMSTLVVLLVALMLTSVTTADHYWQGTFWDEWEFYCSVFAVFGVVCATASQAWRWLGEDGMRAVGEYWGILTTFFALYLYGFDADHWAMAWLVVFLGSLGMIYRGYATGRVHQINLGFTLSGLVMMSFFLRLVGTMFQTGMIFLVGGVGLIGFVVVANWLRRRVLEKIS